MDDLNDQIAQRLKKLDRLRSLGIDPFGGKFPVTDRAGDLIARYGTAFKEALEQNPVNATLAGRVTALRRFGKASFASLQDGLDSLQVYFKKDVLGETGYALSWSRARSKHPRPWRERVWVRGNRCPQKRNRPAEPGGGTATRPLLAPQLGTKA